MKRKIFKLYRTRKKGGQHYHIGRKVYVNLSKSDQRILQRVLDRWLSERAKELQIEKEQKEHVRGIFIKLDKRGSIKKSFGSLYTKKPIFAYPKIPPIKGTEKKPRYHKYNITATPKCPQCGFRLIRGGCPECSRNPSVETDNFSSFTDLGSVSNSLDKAEKQLEQRKIREIYNIKKMPIDTLKEFIERERARMNLEVRSNKERSLLKQARKNLGNKLRR